MNWLLLRGLGRDKKHWYKFPQILKNKTKGKVLTINLPGMDREDKDVPISIQEITDAVRNKWLKEKDDAEWSLCAVSLGGMIALDWCDRYPEDFKHLVTINSSSKSHSKFYERISPLAIKTIAGLFLKKEIRAREEKVLRLTTNDIEITDDVLDFWEEVGKEMYLNRPLFIKQLLAASKFELPASLKVPYTTIVSENDRFTHSSCSKKISKHFNSNLIIHPSAGHDLPTDAPNWLADQLISL